LAALCFAAIALVFCGWGAIKRRPGLALAGRRALAVSGAFVALGAFALVTALYAHDFSLEYVASYSSRSLSRPYTLSALWGGMEGSLLFWTLLLTIFSTIAIRRSRLRNAAVVDRAAAILAGIAVFFISLLVFPANPFRVLADVPSDGTGLNPLLQSPGMMIHPPLLYTGFVAFSIPFAFAMSALIERRLDEDWFTHTRRWTLFAWSALSIGIVLGGAWAYTELGWGGYWAWDPVENASFLPWLTATAYLHSVVIQEKRRMFKAWNISLILMTYLLAVFGTFLTRSGILSSIHTFTEGPIGKWFLPFLAAMLIGGIATMALRSDSLRSENKFDSLLSRESAFLANNVLFLAAAFAILWGTIYPIVAEVTSGVRLSVGPPFFNSVFIPIGLAILILTGIGPLIAWRRMDPGALGRIIRLPLGAAIALTVALGVGGVRSVGALVAFGTCAFTALAVGGEFVRGSRVYRRREGASWGRALQRTLARNRRRYGGYIVHLGVVLIVIGFAGSAFKTERNAQLSKGESMKAGGYTLTYESLETASTPEKSIAQATLRVHKGDDDLGVLTPQRNLHTAQGQFQSEVAIRTTPIEDLYVVVTAFDPDGDASVRAFVNPLTWWIWAGAFVMLIGMSILLTGPIAQPVTARNAARQTAEPVAVGS
jgi:cytochrome c-type biogenesis protein CcmF